MSTRNPNNWTKVGDTVRFWQDVLVRIPDRTDYSVYNRGHHQFGNNNLPVVVHPATMPQSLGELCLEDAQEDLLCCVVENPPESHDPASEVGEHWRNELSALRRAMFMKAENHVDARKTKSG